MECNVAFNEDDVLITNDIAIIPGNALAEGERDKITQGPTNADETHLNQPEPEPKKADKPPNPKPTNSNLFPSEPHPTDKPEKVAMEEADKLLQLGGGHHVQKKPPGASQCVAEAKPHLVASVAEFDLDDDDVAGDLPPAFALLCGMGTKSQSFDEA